MSKKIIAIILTILTVVSVLSLASCGEDENSSEAVSGESKADESKADKNFKAGFICLHDENSTYDKNFIDGIKEAQAKLGLTDDQVIIVTNKPESNECYEAAADLVDQGCSVVFANSFGHESFLIQAAKEFPDVMFCHATGTSAKAENLPNFHNAFASIYEGRYLAGVAAGMKLNEMIESGKITAEQAKMGYVGAFTYAEVISGYSSFYLGAKSVCPSVTMDVTFTGSWFDVTLEKNGAEKLINDGCVLISQHADSMGAPGACEAAGVPNVSYNGSTKDACPNTFIVSSRINWAPYFELMIKAAMGEGELPTDWCGTLQTGSVVLTDVNTQAAAEGTQAKIDEVKAQLEAGTLHVFDVSTFTVDGKALEGDYVKDGYFHESDVALNISAPYFDVNIDGITKLDENFG